MSLINNLTFVKKQHENDDIYTFYFNTPKGLKHKAGQHGLFVLPGWYRPHPFTISSSPDEELVTISTHIGTGSRFKKKLMSMESGDSILFIGPILNFTLRDHADTHVFLAQGIGITPFRSMLFHAYAASLPIITTLIHVDSKGHTFRDLTQEYATHAYYPTNPAEFQAKVKEQDINQVFYLSGSPRFVRATRKFLVERGVKRRNIRTDSFLGY